MNPRLSSSKTWTNFPPEFLEQVQDLVAETFEDHLIEGAGLHLEGRIYPEEILFRLGIKVEGQLKQSNFEASAHYNSEAQNVKKIMHDCIEAAASMMAEFFDFEGDVDFPHQWTEFKFEGTPVFLQYTTANAELEAEADRILGQIEAELVNEMGSQDALDYVIEERIQSDTDDDLEQDDLNFEGEETEDDSETTLHAKEDCDEEEGSCHNCQCDSLKH